MGTRDWLDAPVRLDRMPKGVLQELPPHSDSCFGCGPESGPGLHLRAWLDGDEVVSTYSFGAGHGGTPGIVHGGSVATLADDVMGYLLYVVGEPGVTRRLEVDYLRPVLIGAPYIVRATLVRRDGRKVFARCTGTSSDGHVAFTASALFVLVDLQHFDQGEPPAPRVG